MKRLITLSIMSSLFALQTYGMEKDNNWDAVEKDWGHKGYLLQQNVNGNAQLELQNIPQKWNTRDAHRLAILLGSSLEAATVYECQEGQEKLVIDCALIQFPRNKLRYQLLNRYTLGACFVGIGVGWLLAKQ